MTQKKDQDRNLNTVVKERALLISTYKDPRLKQSCEEHLAELVLLTETYGADVVEKVTCLLRAYDPATVLSSGKLDEMIKIAAELNVDVIIMDDELSPSQQRNLESALKLPVMDRTELILKVFAARAVTKEARAQIELARVRYEAPRLKRLWTHLSRQGGSAGGGSSGSGGHTKGEGEKQIELDRRLLQKKIEMLQAEIEEVRLNRQTQRISRERSGIPTFAIVGYTNAGKSTLMNALTQANVFVEDKLFATLDTTTRKFTLPTKQEILLIDTVGFIRKLPHLLVAAFKGTLEEALFADILINLVDISDPAVFEHVETTLSVLEELGAESRPMIHVLNKVDRLSNRNVITQYKLKYPNVVEISALTGQGISELVDAMVTELKKQRTLVTLKVDQSEYAVVSEVMKLGHVYNTEYEGNDVIISVELPHAVAAKLKRYIQN